MKLLILAIGLEVFFSIIFAPVYRQGVKMMAGNGMNIIYVIRLCRRAHRRRVLALAASHRYNIDNVVYRRKALPEMGISRIRACSTHRLAPVMRDHFSALAPVARSAQSICGCADAATLLAPVVVVVVAICLF